MSFTVLWGLEAMEELTRLWLDADSDVRKSMTQAAHQIDRQLSKDPANTGESRSGEERIWFVPPLGLRFSVNSATRTVRIAQVWQIRKRMA